MPAPSLAVSDYMSSRFTTLKAHQNIQEAVNLFTEKNIFGAAVVDNTGELVGILSVTDCISTAVSSGYNPGWGGTVGDLMSRDVRTVDYDDNIVDVAHLFMQEPYRRYPVLKNNQVVGVITRLDVLKALRRITDSGVQV